MRFLIDLFKVLFKFVRGYESNLRNNDNTDIDREII